MSLTERPKYINSHRKLPLPRLREAPSRRSSVLFRIVPVETLHRTAPTKRHEARYRIDCGMARIRLQPGQTWALPAVQQTVVRRVSVSECFGVQAKINYSGGHTYTQPHSVGRAMTINERNLAGSQIWSIRPVPSAEPSPGLHILLGLDYTFTRVLNRQNHTKSWPRKVLGASVSQRPLHPNTPPRCPPCFPLQCLVL